MGPFITKWEGHLWLKWVGQSWQVAVSFGDMLKQRGRDHFPPKACFYFRSPTLGWLSQYYEYTVAKQNGGGAEWVELI